MGCILFFKKQMLYSSILFLFGLFLLTTITDDQQSVFNVKYNTGLWVYYDSFLKNQLSTNPSEHEISEYMRTIEHKASIYFPELQKGYWIKWKPASNSLLPHISRFFIAEVSGKLKSHSVRAYNKEDYDWTYFSGRYATSIIDPYMLIDSYQATFPQVRESLENMMATSKNTVKNILLQKGIRVERSDTIEVMMDRLDRAVSNDLFKVPLIDVALSKNMALFVMIIVVSINYIVAFMGLKKYKPDNENLSDEPLLILHASSVFEKFLLHTWIVFIVVCPVGLFSFFSWWIFVASQYKYNDSLCNYVLYFVSIVPFSIAFYHGVKIRNFIYQLRQAQS